MDVLDDGWIGFYDFNFLGIFGICCFVFGDDCRILFGYVLGFVWIGDYVIEFL